MLRIGSNTYELVRAYSGFFVWLEGQAPPADAQDWRLELHYVPSEQNPARPDGLWEYLRLTLHPFRFHTPDWHELGEFGILSPDQELDPVLNLSSVENLLARWHHKEEVWDVAPETLVIKPSSGYLFTCELDGSLWRTREDGEDLHLLEEIPFAEAVVTVPINTADPVKAARAFAAREIKLHEMDGNRVTPPDWRRAKDPNAPLSNSHQVVLPTPWRKSLA